MPAFDPLPLDCERSTTVTSQAAVMGLDDFFYASTFILILIIPLIWITRPVKGGGDSGEASAAH